MDSNLADEALDLYVDQEVWPVHQSTIVRRDVVMQAGQETVTGDGIIARALPSGTAARQARSILRQVLRDARFSEEAVGDAELAVGELAANADTHAHEPYELHIITADGYPVGCAVVDSDQDLAGIPTAFAQLDLGGCTPDSGVALMESGRGLAIVHQLSGGRCQAFPTVVCATDLPGKAVAFAFPDRATSTSGA